jgi:hypothetical protein
MYHAQQLALISNVREQQYGELPERLIAFLMTQLVVHRLEAIKVHHQHRERVGVTSRPGLSGFLPIVAVAVGKWHTE